MLRGLCAHLVPTQSAKERSTKKGAQDGGAFRKVKPV